VTIALTRGAVAEVDLGDFQALSQFKWHTHVATHGAYARGVVAGKLVYMHRLLMSAAPGEEVDHIDGNGLNNRRSNLRCATHADQARGYQTKRSGKTSHYRGVSWVTRDRRWTAHLSHLGHQYYLGYFTSEQLAAEAYDAKAIELFGEFAQLNFP